MSISLKLQQPNMNSTFHQSTKNYFKEFINTCSFEDKQEFLQYIVATITAQKPEPVEQKPEPVKKKKIILKKKKTPPVEVEEQKAEPPVEPPVEVNEETARSINLRYLKRWLHIINYCLSNTTSTFIHKLVGDDWREIVFKDETKTETTYYTLKMDFNNILSKYKLRVCYNKWVAQEKKNLMSWNFAQGECVTWNVDTSVKKWDKMVVGNIETDTIKMYNELEYIQDEYEEKIGRALERLDIDYYEDGCPVYKNERCVLHQSKK